MKPIITFECTNKKCEKFGKKIKLQYYTIFDNLQDSSTDEDYLSATVKLCRRCFRTGEVEIRHGDRKFSVYDAFDEYIFGLVKEANLLKKLVDRGVAGEDEKREFDECVQLLVEIKCPFCGQPIIEMNENEARVLHKGSPAEAEKTHI